MRQCKTCPGPNIPRIKNFLYTDRRVGQHSGVVVPRGRGGRVAQVKSVTENELRVACKFDIEATPDMPKRIRQGRRRRRSGSKARELAQGAAKVLHSFFFYRFLFQLLPQAFIPLSQPPLLTPFYYSPVLLQQSNCSLASILFSVQKAPEKTHTPTHTHRGRAEKREGQWEWVRGEVHKQRLQFGKLS